MGNTLTVRLRGVNTLDLKVKYLINAARTALKLSVPEAALLVQEEAKALCPVETGALRDSIAITAAVDEPDTQVATVAPGGPADNKWGWEPPYARRIEFGFVGVDSLGRHYNQAAQPFMRPAFDAKKDEARQVIKEGLLSALEDANARRSR